jgi:sirohydrochlorin cobaltochelatase
MPGSGLLLLAHGARDPQWARPFEQVAAAVQTARPQLPVQLAFLEFMAPDIAGASAALAAAGCTDVHVLPLFLGAGGHVRKDLPPLLEQLRARHPGVAFTLHPAVGEAPILIAAMAEIALTLPAAR